MLIDEARYRVVLAEISHHLREGAKLPEVALVENGDTLAESQQMPVI